MFELDDSFLDEVGLTNMPEEQKGDFLAYAQDQLETRIGEKMSEGVDEAKLEDFDKITENDQDVIARYLPQNYVQDPLYQNLKQNMAEAGLTNESVESQYAMVRWLNAYCPNYAQIAQDVANGLRDEIMAGRADILA